MATAAPIRFVEQFHLLFLVQLSRRVDKSRFVVKGGCNLRFFHGSIRYSEDMGLDVSDLDPLGLRDTVRELLGSRPFAQILDARGIHIDHVTEHKQTDTTQRWKLGLRVRDNAVPLPTKVECSRRGLDEGVVFGSVDANLAHEYQLPPLMVSHYTALAALRQKVGALAGRREIQARDVFDLHHLMMRGGAAVAAPGLDSRMAERAIANALSVDFGMFKSQVLAYLRPADQTFFDSSAVWDTVVLEVVDALKAGRP
jgi:predicted nucleotidyltransferase component of viral defense system